MEKKAVILSDKIKINKNSKEHEVDTYQQVQQVGGALKEMGYTVSNIEFNLDMRKISKKLLKIKPDFIFNLVEEEDYIILAPLLLRNLHLKYTGCKADIIHFTNSKLIFKKHFENMFSKISNLKIPGYVSFEDYSGFNKNKKYILKAEKYHSSLGIDHDSVRKFDSLDELFRALKKKEKEFNAVFFAEEFIDGREFNIAILAGEILPIAEMTFVDYPEDKPKVVCYKAKWQQDAFEYSNTVRNFEFSKEDKKLIKNLSEITRLISDTLHKLPCARIDFIVDKNNTPYILEINANPCLNKDAGYFGICEEIGLNYKDMIKKIIKAAHE